MGAVGHGGQAISPTVFPYFAALHVGTWWSMVFVTPRLNARKHSATQIRSFSIRAITNGGVNTLSNILIRIYW